MQLTSERVHGPLAVINASNKSRGGSYLGRGSASIRRHETFSVSIADHIQSTMSRPVCLVRASPPPSVVVEAPQLKKTACTSILLRLPKHSSEKYLFCAGLLLLLPTSPSGCQLDSSTGLPRRKASIHSWAVASMWSPMNQTSLTRRRRREASGKDRSCRPW